VNKADLIERIAKDAGINKTQADAAINSVLSGVEGELKKGGRVTLVGFGTFSVGSRKARTGRNPQTGKPIKIAAKKSCKVYPWCGAEGCRQQEEVVLSLLKGSANCPFSFLRRP
jgi:DNA-binding protein HU-beta